MHGVINLLKPPGMTSHDAVMAVRRMLGVRRVGHTGTLDPGAAGVLPIVVGKATRLVQWMQKADKSYRAEMTLGVETDTLDAAGKTTAMNTDFAIPVSRLVDQMHLQLGHILQTPPMVSSVKVDGERLYKAALRGDEVERPKRAVRIDHIEIIKIFPHGTLDLNFGARVLFAVTCSKGTYIRSLVADIGRALGCGAHLSFLVRTRSGPYTLEESWTFEELREAARRGASSEFLLPPESGVPDLTRIDLSPDDDTKIRHGQAIEAADDFLPGTEARLHGPRGGLVAIARCEERLGRKVWQPVTVLFGPGED